MKHCLVVDDSRVIRKVACRILEDLHFEAEEAEDGATALEACRIKMPDVILLDGNMQAMSGIEFLRILRGARDGDKPVIVLCTTENDVARISDAMSAGADEYMLKPFDIDVVRSKLADIGLV
jgi:two-component system chemotaxis response regulator CheY